MKRRSKLFFLVLCLSLFAALTLPLGAQDWVEGPGPGEGGTVLLNLGDSDPATFNPLIASDGTSADVYAYLYPAIFTINPQTGESEPNLSGALAESWEYDETGTILTINLRQDMFWSDGTPITSADYMWGVEAVRSGETSSPRTSIFQTLADGTPGGGKIVSIEAPDEHTVVVTFSEADCIAFEDVNDIVVVPAHEFEEFYGGNYAAMDEDPRRIPTATYGPFTDLEFEPGVRTSFIADQNYSNDSYLGYVSPGELTQLIIPNTDIATERFIAGELSILAVQGNRQEEFRNTSDFQTFEFTRNGYVFVGMNNADPNDPLPGIDADGNIVPQTPHPVLGDKLVRQAITQAVDVQALIDGILDGNAVPVGTHTIPTSWVYDPDLQYVFDPEAAMAKLEEAGWVDSDGDGIRECQNCLYAREVDADFEGSPMELSLLLTTGDPTNELWSALFQDSLAEIGIALDVQEVDWSSVFLPAFYGQNFDMLILAWGLGLPVDPDVSWLFYPEVDQPGSGFNMVSYYNEELVRLNDAARVVPGCDPDARRELYAQVQQILHEDSPYFFLYVNNSMTAAQLDMANWNPTSFSRTYSIDAWVMPEARPR